MSQSPNKTVLITGCSTGIGRSTAKRLAGNGWNVYATARRPESIADLAGPNCTTLQLDVTDEQSMVSAVEAVEGAEGAVDALINNAGYSQSGAVETVSPEAMRRQFETNVFGLVRMCQLVLPGMRRQRSGRIINLSSMGGKLTFPGGGMYHGTKHAVEAISDALRFEVAGFGIKVVLIEPGLITTEFANAAGASLHDAALDGDDPYAKFNDRVGAMTSGIYESPMRHFGTDADGCARAIERVLRKRHPRPRYSVTPSAKFTLAAHALTPDRLWDAAMSVGYPRPAAK
jgi:NADP-dependent 3-hydroxy acid dehydrogenase YdfG